MNNLIENKKWESNLIRHLWDKKQITPINFTDLTFVCADGTIAAHRAYLSVNCSLIDNVFKDYVDNDVAIIVPDVRVETVQKFLEIMYTGSAVFDNDEGLEELDIFGSLILGFSVAMFWNTTISSVNPDASEDDDPKVDDVTDLTTDETQLEEQEIADVEIVSNVEDEEALTSKVNQIQRANHQTASANPTLPRKGNSFGCRYCSQMFCSPIELAFHVKTDHHFRINEDENRTMAKTSTPAQSKVLQSPLDLTNNRSSERVEFRCSFCSRIFKSVIELAFHAKTEHTHLLTPISHGIESIGKRRQPVTDCKLNSTKRAKMLNNNEIDTGRVVFPCQHCQRTFPLLSLLKLHLKNFHNEKSNGIFKTLRAQRANQKTEVVYTENGRNLDFKSIDIEEDQKSLESNQEGSLPKKETRGRKPMPRDENGKRITNRKTLKRMRKLKDSKMAVTPGPYSGPRNPKKRQESTLGLHGVAIVTLEKLSFCKICENYFENREQLKSHINSNHKFGHEF